MGLRQNAMVLVVLTVLLAVVADWSDTTLLSRSWCLPAGLLLAGLAYEAWVIGRTPTQLTIASAERWLVGRATEVRFTLTVGRAQALAVQVLPAAPAEITMAREPRTLWAQGEALWQQTASARRLGQFSWPAMQTRLGGALGLAWWPRRISSHCQVHVIPDVLHELQPALDANERGARAVRRAGSGADILQLRPYRPTDPPRAIDWKATARTGALISRDFAEDQHLDVVLALDVGRSSGLRAGDTDRLTLYANIAARLAQRAVMFDDRVGLLLYADRPLASMVPAHGTSALIRLRALLSQISVQDRDANPAMAALRIRALARQRCLVVVLTELDDASQAGELLGAVRLLLPKHLPFVAGVASRRIGEFARAPALESAAVYQALAAQEYRSTLWRNVAALRAMGAPAVLAAPEDLDRAVLDAYLSFRQRRRI